MRRLLYGLGFSLLTGILGAGCGGSDSLGSESDESNETVRHTLYIHGRTTDGLPSDWGYWGRKRAGVDPIPVNWNGAACIASENPIIVGALDKYCVGNQWCYVLCHSAGCAQIEYALDKHGAKDDGGSRWNIYWVLAGGSAEGGSELADYGAWATSNCIDHDLKPSVMRALYDHNATRGVQIHMYAGANGSVQSALLPGEDDGAVAYHSAGGVNHIGSFTNPTDWTGTTLTPQVGLFANRVLAFVDTSALYPHFTASTNGGIFAVSEGDVPRKETR